MSTLPERTVKFPERSIDFRVTTPQCGETGFVPSVIAALRAYAVGLEEDYLHRYDFSNRPRIFDAETGIHPIDDDCTTIEWRAAATEEKS